MRFGMTPTVYWPLDYWPLVALDHGTPQEVSIGAFDIADSMDEDFVIDSAIAFTVADLAI